MALNEGKYRIFRDGGFSHHAALILADEDKSDYGGHFGSGGSGGGSGLTFDGLDSQLVDFSYELGSTPVGAVYMGPNTSFGPVITADWAEAVATPAPHDPDNETAVNGSLLVKKSGIYHFAMISSSVQATQGGGFASPVYATLDPLCQLPGGTTSEAVGAGFVGAEHEIAQGVSFSEVPRKQTTVTLVAGTRLYVLASLGNATDAIIQHTVLLQPLVLED